MFKSLDLSLIVEFILMFYRDKPIDWLLDHILWVKVCNPEKDAVSRAAERQAGRCRTQPPAWTVSGDAPDSGHGAAGRGGSCLGARRVLTLECCPPSTEAL